MTSNVKKHRATLARGPASVSVVKTTDLIYVFCAGAWVNVATSIVPSGLNIPALLLLALTFSMVPLELYTSSLWESVVDLYPETHENADKSAAILSAVDIGRIFFLTMSFIYLYCPIDFWINIKPSAHIFYNSTSIFSFCLGMFLVMNWSWNLILFKRASGEGNTPYGKLFASFEEELRTNGRKSDYYSDNFIWTASIFKDVNLLFFQKIFPIVGVIMVLSSILYSIIISNISFDFFGDTLVSLVGWISLIVFMLQFTFKLFHIVFVSMIYGSVRYSRTIAGTHTNEAEAL